MLTRILRTAHVIALVPVILGIGTTAQAEDPRPADLPLPSELPLLDYEKVLYPFIANRLYVGLGWTPDKAWRDTGPFILQANYGVHPAVRIYYSPGMITWLEAGRQGEIPDGAMIVKEMVSPPAARYNEILAEFREDDPATAEEKFLAYLKKEGGLNWTVLIRDKSVSKGGWMFSSVGQSQTLDTFGPPFNPPATGAGIGTCMRCHASSDGMLTFSDLDNVAGYPGQPLQFRVDESWRQLAGFPTGPFNLPPEQLPAGGASEGTLIEDHFHQPAADTPATKLTAGNPDAGFVAAILGGTTAPKDPGADVQVFPGQWLDKVPSRPDGPQHFLTSDNCYGCHGGLGGPPSGTVMFLQTGPEYGEGYNISEYGEWRWTPMGLAGRDPVFYSQLEGEFALLDKAGAGDLKGSLGTTCLSCHGAMGQRQLEIDAHQGGYTDLDPNNFKMSYVMLHTPLTVAQEDAQRDAGTLAYSQYGNLAREGISCAVCHHIDRPEGLPGAPARNKLDTYLMNGTTGVFRYTPPDVLIGPYDDVRQRPMQNALGITPQGNPYIKDSELCGACHTINLPNVDAPTDKPLPGFSQAEQDILNEAAQNGATYLAETYGVSWPQPLTQFQHSIEQATYLEWVNSGYGDTSCQDCHMQSSFQTLAGDVDIENLTTQIASIQDSTYPQVANQLPSAEIDVPFREGYHRHNFVGLNAFLIEMFKQFDPVLGLAESDYMTGAKNGADQQIENMLLQARDWTVDMALEATGADGAILADLTLTSKVGHRFPSGVGFRRAFIELKVTDKDGKPIWCSGCTDAFGVILGADGQPLKTEFLDYVPQGAKLAIYQPHYQVIDAQDQVQIYEELTRNAEGQFTASFIQRDTHPKDNRILPKGWLEPGSPAFNAKFDGSEVTTAFLGATEPDGGASTDPDFGPGTDALRYKITLPDGISAADAQVTATLYYQAFPPWFLRQRFLGSPDGEATQRLFYIASRLETQGTAIENWKLQVQQATAQPR